MDGVDRQEASMHGHRKGLDEEVSVGEVGAHLGDLRDDDKDNDDHDHMYRQY